MKQRVFLIVFILYLSCSKSSENVDEVEQVNTEQTIQGNQTTSETTSTTVGTSTAPSPAPTFDRESMLIFWADSIIVPAYQNFNTDLLILSESVNAFASNPSEVNLDLVRSNWITSYKSWQHIEMFNIGMAEEIFYINRMNVYPLNVSRVENNISSSDFEIEHPNDYPAQGFPALDYLLFGIGSNDSEILEKFNSENSSYLMYLVIITNKMVELTNIVINDWPSYRDVFIASTENTATSSINKLTNDFIYYYEKGFRANKIGIPAGVFSADELPELVEAYYKKDISKTLALEAINAISAFFKGQAYNDENTTGNSFKTYLEFLQTTKDGNPLGQLIIDQFEIAKNSINELNDDFTIQIQNDNLQMLLAYDHIQVAVVLMKVDMLQALNINVDYIDADGD